MTEKTVWGIHAGKFSEADGVFLEQKRIALGWEEMGDLRLLPPERDAFKQKVVETYPKEKPGSWPISAGQLFRFTHEMKSGDLIVYPSKKDRKMHIGEITGEYEYSPVISNSYPHQRVVKWLKEVDRVKFSQGALYEVGSALSFFQIRNYADEFIGMTDRHIPGPEAFEVDSGPNADDMEEITRDYILKKLSTELKGFPLEEFISHLLEKMGYHTRLSSHGGDEGIDIIAHRDELGFEPPIIKVQIKSRNDTVKQDEVAALYGRLAGDNEVGLFVTLSSYAAQARSFAKSKEKIRLIDGSELVELIFEHYDDFDGKYKALLPLRRVFMPDPESED
jgi:restriction system protein